MIDQETGKVLTLSMDIAAQMLRCGGDVHRVEQTVTFINKAYGAQSVEVFSVNSMVLCTVKKGEETATESRRVTSYTTDLNRLEDLNSLSRSLCAEKPDMETARHQLEALSYRSPLDLPLRFLGYVVGAASFCAFFGGAAADCIVSALIAALLFCADRWLLPHFPNKLIYTILTAAGMGLLACAASRAGLVPHADKTMIGDVMLQIPGLILINGLRDMLLGDTMTGIMRVVEALATATAIAVGFALALLILPVQIVASSNGPVVQTVSAIISILAFCQVYHVKRKRQLPIIAGGALTTVIFVCCMIATDDMFICCVIPAVVCGLLSELLARTLKAPTTVFLLPGLVPLLPGNALYYTMSSIVQTNAADAISYGRLTVEESAAIAVGVVASSILAIILTKLLTRMKKHTL